jgi:hypothetical protein
MFLTMMTITINNEGTIVSTPVIDSHLQKH